MNYLYLFNKRIFKVIDYSQFYEPVVLPETVWRLVFDEVPRAIRNDPVHFRWYPNEGFIRDITPISEDEINRIAVLRIKIAIWERFNSIAATHKIMATRNEYAHSLHQHLLFAELEAYHKNSEFGPILQAYYATNPNLNMESFTAAMELKAKDLSYVFANIIRIRYRVHLLIEQERYGDAHAYLNEEAGKLNG